MNVVIIDYGVSNLSSIKQAIEICGESPIVTSNPDELQNATHIILPGVGAFKDGMENLINNHWVESIKEFALNKKIPFLGVCLGMQLLCDEGSENGQTKGLGLIPGKVKKLQPKTANDKIPHVGWNEVNFTQNSPLFDGINSSNDFYFVHSYHFVPKENNNIISTTPYCGNFVSAIYSKNIFGTQFHPEKSQRLGLQLLTNFLKI